MFLNLGCGFQKYEGYVNVDSAPECKPDVVWDLEQTPWPWEDNSVDGIKLEHVLEHLGETTQAYLNIWKEMYRVCKNGALIEIIVPHWRHDNFYNDPTHVRAITPIGIMVFNQEINLRHVEENNRATKLGLFTGVDIDLKDEDVEYFYTEEIASAVASGALPYSQMEILREHQNNVSNEIRMKARVIKPARGSQSHD